MVRPRAAESVVHARTAATQIWVCLLSTLFRTRFLIDVPVMTAFLFAGLPTGTSRRFPQVPLALQIVKSRVISDVVAIRARK